MRVPENIVASLDRRAWRRTGLALAGMAALWTLYWIVRGAAPEFHARWLRGEDRLIEWITFAGFATAGALCIGLARRPANRWLRLWRLGLALFFLVCAGEEISWGQRIFGFGTPDAVAAHNEQDEFNLHNLRFEHLSPLALVSWCLKCFGIVGPLALALRRRGLEEPGRDFFPAPGVIPLFVVAELLGTVRRQLTPWIVAAWGDATALVVKLDTAEFKEMVWGVSCAVAALALRDYSRRPAK
jgi:hypothetical protein